MSYPFSIIKVITATHSFQFTVFLQNRNCSNKILPIIIIPPWFQACIYWKFASWRHHFQLSIFSVIVSLFHGSTWRNPKIKETVFVSQHFLQPSIIISGLWLIQEKVEEWPCSFKGAYLFHRTSCNIFFEKYCVKCTKALTEIPFFHGEPA